MTNKEVMEQAFQMGAGFTLTSNKQLFLVLLILMLLFWFMYYITGAYKEYRKKKEAHDFYKSMWVSVAVLTVLIGIYSAI